MRGWPVLLLLALVQADPARILTDRLGFSAREVDQARNGQPIVKMLATTARDQLGIVGAIRLSGTKERLADWLRNIEHFRNSAQLGTTHVVPMPPAVKIWCATTATALSQSSGTGCIRPAFLPVDMAVPYWSAPLSVPPSAGVSPPRTFSNQWWAYGSSLNALTSRYPADL